MWLCTICQIRSNAIVRSGLNFLKYGKWDRLTRVRRVEGVTPTRIPLLLWSGSAMILFELERVKSPRWPSNRIATRCASPRSGDPASQEQRPGIGTKAPMLCAVLHCSTSNKATSATRAQAATTQRVPPRVTDSAWDSPASQDHRS